MHSGIPTGQIQRIHPVYHGFVTERIYLIHKTRSGYCPILLIFPNEHKSTLSDAAQPRDSACARHMKQEARAGLILFAAKDPAICFKSPWTGFRARSFYSSTPAKQSYIRSGLVVASVQQRSCRAPGLILSPAKDPGGSAAAVRAVSPRPHGPSPTAVPVGSASLKFSAPTLPPNPKSGRFTPPTPQSAYQIQPGPSQGHNIVSSPPPLLLLLLLLLLPRCPISVRVNN